MSYQDRRSYSQLDVWLTCPEQYRLKYVERIPEQPSIWTLGGTAFHAVAEKVLRGDVVNVEQAWRDAWQDAVDEREKREPGFAQLPESAFRKAGRGTEGIAWWFQHGPQMVDRFIRWWNTRAQALQVHETTYSNTGLTYPSLEVRLEVELGGVPVVAIPDAVVVDEHGQLDILDYKSGSRAPTKPLQLSLYRAAIDAAWGLTATWGLFYMTRAGEAIPWDLSKYHTPEQIGEMFALFDADEKAGWYIPNPGEHCRVCPFRQTCEYKA